MNEQTSPIKEFSVQMGLPQTSQKPSEKGAATPFRMLWVADLAPHVSRHTDWKQPSQLLSVDKFNFSDLLERMSPQLNLEVPNHLSQTAKILNLSLSFNYLHAFSPEGIINQVPALSQWLGVRNAVSEVKRKILSPEQFAEQLKVLGIEESRADALYQKVKAVEKIDAPKPSSSGGGSGLDGLLGMVDISNAPKVEAPPPSDDPLEALLKALGASHAANATPKAAAVNKSAVDELLTELDGMINTQLNVILHNPKYQALESAWRTLKIMVDRLSFRQNVRLEVLVAGKDQVNEALHEQIVMPCYEQPPAVPFATIVLDFAYGDEPLDLERLSDLCDAGASLQVPLVAAAAAKIWGVKDASGKLRYTNLQQQLEGSEFLGWSVLKKGDAAQYLTLALPHVLLRPLYREESKDGFAFQERVDMDGTGYLWGRASAFVALAMSQSYVSHGWASRFVGIGSFGTVSDLPMWRTNGDIQTPLMVFADQTKQKEAPAAGFAVLASRPNSDEIYVAGAHSIKKVLDYIDDEARAEAETHATLACQMVTSKIANALVLWQLSIKSGDGKEKVASSLTQTLSNILSEGGHEIPEDAIKIEVDDSPRSEEHLGVGVWLNIPKPILGEVISMALGFEVPK
jgi:type VI secretion system protein ImpC